MCSDEHNRKLVMLQAMNLNFLLRKWRPQDLIITIILNFLSCSWIIIKLILGKHGLFWWIFFFFKNPTSYVICTALNNVNDMSGVNLLLTFCDGEFSLDSSSSSFHTSQSGDLSLNSSHLSNSMVQLYRLRQHFTCKTPQQTKYLDTQPQRCIHFQQ